MLPALCHQRRHPGASRDTLRAGRRQGLLADTYIDPWAPAPSQRHLTSIREPSYRPGMDRRRFLVTSLAGALVAPLATEAQHAGKVHRIGVIALGGPRPAGPRVTAFDLLIREMTEQLRARGWVEGQNIALEYRFDEGKRERLPMLAADLVDLKVSVIVTVGTPAALAAKGATATIPIVMINVGDPVRSGLAASLARPGSNVTGMAYMGPEITFKQVELLKEIQPLAEALGVLFDPLNPGQVDHVAEVIPAAAA